MTQHIPVLLNEVLLMLSPQNEGIYFDGTLGGGGYTKAILDAVDCKVIACDRDPFTRTIAEKLKDDYGERFYFSHAKFSDIKSIVELYG